MAGIRAVEGVDNTLVNIATAAVASLTPRPLVTVGPLDRDDDVLRLNWFLYSLNPSTAFRNMEHPRTGTTTARGNPPLALELNYVLTAHPGPLTASGQEAQFAHRGLVAVMQALHDGPIIGEDSPFLAPEAAPLVEPLRISHDPIDLDGASKLWTAASQPMRASVGYRVSLAIVDSTLVHVPGPPVRERRFAVVPSMGAQFATLNTTRVNAGAELVAELRGAVGEVAFSLRREPNDPDGPNEWPLTATPAGPSAYELDLSLETLAAGGRQLSVTGSVNGLPAGGDRTAITLVPAVTAAPTPGAAGSTVALATTHAGEDVEVFFDGVALDPADVTFVSATQVDIVVPLTAATGMHSVALRSAQTAGPVFETVEVT
ncbi:MAG: DUF4255 domain-containing protein [Acidimicrobiales bacterium]